MQQRYRSTASTIAGFALLLLVCIWFGREVPDLRPVPPPAPAERVDQNSVVTSPIFSVPPPPQSAPFPSVTGSVSEPPVWVEGMVLGVDGVPIQGIRIRRSAPLVVGQRWYGTLLNTGVLTNRGPEDRMIVGPDFAVDHGVIVATTGEDGRFAIPAPEREDTYRLTFHPPAASGAHPSDDLARTLIRIQDLSFVRNRYRDLGVLEAGPTCVLEGTVIQADGRPAGWAEVGWWPENLGEKLGRRSGRLALKAGRADRRLHLPVGLGQVVADREGRFRIEGVPSVPVLLHARLTGAMSSEARRAQGAEARIRLTLPPPRRPFVYGRVLDHGTSEAIAAHIAFRNVSDDEQHGTTGGLQDALPDGSFRLEDLQPGTVRVTIRAPGYAEWQSEELRLGPEAALGELESRLRPE